MKSEAIASSGGAGVKPWQVCEAVASLFMVTKLNLRNIPQDALVRLHRQVVDELNARGHAARSTTGDANLIYRRTINGRKEKRKLEDLAHPTWLDLFPSADGERRFYVYAHVHPGTKPVSLKHPVLNRWLKFSGLPFYVGKGCGQRAWDLSRNEGHGAQLKSLAEKGLAASEIVTIVLDKLTEAEALRLEAQLIYLLGTKFETSVRGILVNLDLPKRPAEFRR